VFGVEEIVSAENEANLIEIPEIWQKAKKDGTIDRIAAMAGVKYDDASKGIKPVNAVMCYRDTGIGSFPYMLFAFTPEGGVEDGFVRVDIPTLAWAIFTCDEHAADKTTEVIQALWKRIYSEWFPTSTYEHDTGPEFEMYGVYENGKEYCEVWIPVKKK
jgi:AraC family transcriptional regulator